MKTLSVNFLFLCCMITVNGQEVNKFMLKKANITPSTTFVFGTSNVSQIPRIKELVKQYWTLTDNYEVLPMEEAVKKVKESKNAVFAELVAVSWQTMTLGTGAMKGGGDASNQFTILWGVNQVNSIVRVYLENEITDGDIIYALLLSQFYLKNAAQFSSNYVWKESAEKYGNMLQSKTLLVNKNDLEKITEQEIAAVYPYKFKVVDYDKIEEAIRNQSKNELILYYGRFIWKDNTTQPLKVIFNPAEGQIVSYATSKLSVGKMGIRNMLVEKDFEQFVKNTK